MLLTKFYPKAHANRKHGADPSLTSRRMAFLFAASKSFVTLQLLFLVLFCYTFGAIYQQTPRIHNFKILFVDYDGGAVGQAVQDAYEILRGDSFPTLVVGDATVLGVGDLREEVCKGRYWAAFDEAARYNQSDVLTYIWNEARYPAIADVDIAAKLQALSDAARTLYLTSSISLLNTNNTAAVAIFTNPWVLTGINIKPTVQGARIIYSTLCIILILIQEFFYLGTINALYSSFFIYTALYPHRIIAYRVAISLTYTLVGSLCTTGVIYAFRVSFSISGTQFALTWAILWLFAHANFQILDVLTVWIPAPYMPLALISWMMLNVTSFLVPFELSPAFYRLGYALPAHEVYEVLVDIWSGGCNPKLYYALPILFSLEMVAGMLSAVGVYRRCHFAVLAEEAQNEAFGDKVAAAVAFERKKEAEREEARMVKEEGRVDGGVGGKVGGGGGLEVRGAEADLDTEEGEREELADVIRGEQGKIERRLSRATSESFGPSFGVV